MAVVSTAQAYTPPRGAANRAIKFGRIDRDLALDAESRR
jgi:hypothetical protein